jgi:hypothetical protein
MGVPVTSVTPGTYVNLSFAVTTTEGVTTNSKPATLVVSALPVPTPIPTTVRTATPAPVILIQPVIPQVFQHIPQGIFTNPHPNPPAPVVRAAVASASVIDPSVAPVLLPPSTGNAGLKALGRQAAAVIQ